MECPLFVPRSGSLSCRKQFKIFKILWKEFEVIGAETGSVRSGVFVMLGDTGGEKQETFLGATTFSTGGGGGFYLFLCR